MLIECCSMEKVFNNFYSLSASRLCKVRSAYKECFQVQFAEQLEIMHRLETNKIRNIGKLFSHLLVTDSISWSVLRAVRLTEEDTTSGSRIFIKVLFQDMAECWGLKRLEERFDAEEEGGNLGGFLEDL